MLLLKVLSYLQHSVMKFDRSNIAKFDLCYGQVNSLYN